MRYARLGKTDMEVSVVCCGTMAMGPHHTYGERPDDAASAAAVHAALSAGINFFDTAEAYGDGYAEETLGAALADTREQPVVATKASREHLGRSELARACEGSLRRLQRERIDLYQVHWASREVPLEETVSALEGLQAEGKVRTWGVSNFGRRDLPAVLELAAPVSNQVPYSLLWRAIEHHILALCASNDVSVLCYSPLAQGILTGKFARAADVPAPRLRPRYCQGDRTGPAFGVVAELRRVSAEIGEAMADIALAWVLSQPGVTSVVCGMRTPEQAAQNARASNLRLPQGIVDRLTAASDSLKAALDDDPDMWQGGGSSRYR